MWEIISFSNMFVNRGMRFTSKNVGKFLCQQINPSICLMN